LAQDRPEVGGNGSLRPATGLNFAWSAIFFGLHRIGAALIEIVALDMLVLATIVLFLRRDRWAGVLLLPYLAWLLFASALTRAFWQLN